MKIWVFLLSVSLLFKYSEGVMFTLYARSYSQKSAPYSQGYMLDEN